LAVISGWAFVTYRNYLAAYTELLTDFGDSPTRFAAIEKGVVRAATGRMAPLDPKKPRDEIGRALRNAWATEVAMALPRAIDTGDERFTAASLHWLGPQAYYAVYQAGLATFLAKAAPLPQSHQQFLKGMHSQFIEKALLPAPWDAACGAGTVEAGGHTFAGCVANSTPASTSTYPTDRSDAENVVSLALKTTRDRRFREVRQTLIKSKSVKTKAGKPAKNLTRARQDQEYRDMSPTTTFDFLYRLRIRSNYRDADTFLSPYLSGVTAFYEELTELTRATLHALESLVVLAVGEPWFRARLSEFGQRRLPTFAANYSVLARWP
jgi:hypothetical protein